MDLSLSETALSFPTSHLLKRFPSSLPWVKVEEVEWSGVTRLSSMPKTTRTWSRPLNGIFLDDEVLSQGSLRMRNSSFNHCTVPGRNTFPPYCLCSRGLRKSNCGTHTHRPRRSHNYGTGIGNPHHQSDCHPPFTNLLGSLREAQDHRGSDNHSFSLIEKYYQILL